MNKLHVNELLSHFKNESLTLEISENDSADFTTTLQLAEKIRPLLDSIVIDWQLTTNNVLKIQVAEVTEEEDMVLEKTTEMVSAADTEYVLTQRGKEVVANFIRNCEAKRKELLDAGIDTANETVVPTEKDILSDLNYGIGVDDDGDYYNHWGVTDNYDSNLISLSFKRDFVSKENDSVPYCFELISHFRDIPDKSNDPADKQVIDRVYYTFQIHDNILVDIMCITDYKEFMQYAYVMETGENSIAYGKDDSGKEIYYPEIELEDFAVKRLCLLALTAYNSEYNPIDLGKLCAYLREDKILEFDSDKDCMDYFNRYDYKVLDSVEELNKYQGNYGFNIFEKRYHVLYDDALDVWY